MPEHMPMPSPENKPDTDVDESADTVRSDELEEVPSSESVDVEVESSPLPLESEKAPWKGAPYAGAGQHFDVLGKHEAEEEELRLRGVAEDAMKEPIEEIPVTQRSPGVMPPQEESAVSGVRERVEDAPAESVAPEGEGQEVTMSVKGTLPTPKEHPIKRWWNKLTGKEDAA